MKKHSYEFADVWYSVSGDRFFPSRLRMTGKVKILRALDPGDIRTLGIYRGRPSPYGACDVECTVKGPGKILYLAKHLKKELPRVRSLHATSIVFWILWRGTQGNMALSAQELAALASTKVPLAMDYIFVEK